MLILYIKAIVLGIIEGLTEFIPVSSTGHLLAFGDILNFDTPSKDLFIIVIQLGAILAVCYEYRQKLFKVLFGLFSSKKKEKKSSWHFALSILIAFIPSVIVGAFLYSYIKEIFASEYMLLIIGTSLILGGFVFLVVEKHHSKFEVKDVDKVSFKKCLAIGCCQILSMVPGVSRSGATIIGGLMTKLDRKTATEFSFFLAIPTMFAATFYDIYKNWSNIKADDFLLILVGFIVSYISALVVIRFAINYVKKNSFRPFAYYRIVAGLLCIGYFLI